MVKDFRGLQERLRQRLLAEIAAGELTGLELARRTGFQQAHISNFLNRKRGLSLQAMDEVLKVRGLTVSDLAAAHDPRSARRRTIHAAAAEMTHIPLVDGENCLATEIPYSLNRNALQSMTTRLQKLPVRMMTPRPQWQRFVAIRVNPSDAAAMAPRLPRGSTVVIDRHSNAADHRHSIYLIRSGNKIALRYVEKVAGAWLSRPHNPEYPLEVLKSVAGIIGRVCLVLAEI